MAAATAAEYPIACDPSTRGCAFNLPRDTPHAGQGGRAYTRRCRQTHVPSASYKERTYGLPCASRPDSAGSGLFVELAEKSSANRGHFSGPASHETKGNGAT
ncbi:hypothetical protein AAFF_G00434810 [Aldrovandia affinis]|uniref:Uncharacterized protein n=1 Tax=Aldrovandia affinis TaxID=143900 RepID=A0AAD7S8R5_9TELE|nr:hypothetical protein AAFF_G00434810 [Aldrovandia affinis]